MGVLEDQVEALALLFRDQSSALAKARADLATLLSAEKRLEMPASDDLRHQRESLEAEVEEMRTSLENLRVRLAAVRSQAAAALKAEQAALPD